MEIKPNKTVSDQFSRNDSLFGKLHNSIFNFSRLQKRVVLVLADLLLLAGALWLALALRYGSFDLLALERFGWLFVALPIAGVGIFWRLRLYNMLLRSMEGRAISILAAGAIALSVLLYLAGLIDSAVRYPRSLPAIFGLLVFVGIGGLRVLLRAYFRHLLSTVYNKSSILIYGAGTVGLQLSAIIQTGQEFNVAGFIDDDPALKGTYIGGLKVHNPSKISKLVERHKVTRILVAHAGIGPEKKRALLAQLGDARVQLQTVPKPNDVISGRVSLDELRQVKIEDLLGRDAVPPIAALFDQALAGKSVLVTGAGGSIGSQLCQELLKLGPRKAVFLETSELALYQLEQSVVNADDNLKSENVIYLLGNVLERGALKQLFNTHSIDIVYHAAAYKHVPLVEKNAREGVRNNVVGTRIIAEEALAAGVERFILVSTDKAVRPTNVMGASKRAAELIIQDLQSRSNKTVFAMVRFGNVLGSSGSVLPLFKRQIDSGGPVTVTDPEVTRFFMTTAEAAQLVIQAGSLAEGGEVYVLDMGEPIKILELARLMIKLSGKTVKQGEDQEGDIEISFSGLRPGEKLYEELLIDQNVKPTIHPKIMRANERRLDGEEMKLFLNSIDEAIIANDVAGLRLLLAGVVEGYS